MAIDRKIARGGVLGWLIIGWLAVAVASAPAIYLSTPRGSLSTPVAVLSAALYAVSTYMPWALATPALLRFCLRMPIGGRARARSIIVLAATGVPTTLALAACGTLLGRAVLWAMSSPLAVAPFRNTARPIFVTTLFALPTYVAVVAIGQALGWSERDRQREQQLIDARETALRAHLQPHFLFNALNAIAEIGHSDAQRADNALVHLSGLLRTTLEAPAMHALKQELAVSSDLVALHQLLSGEQLQWQVDVAYDGAAWPVPALLLQPLIENALKFAGMTGQGTVSVSAGIIRDHLLITIANSVGHAARPGTGHGLAMVRSRLEAVYGSAANLAVGQSLDQYRATLSLPSAQR